MKELLLLIQLMDPNHNAPEIKGEHENHQWLNNRYNEQGLSCCSGGKSGDCQPVPFSSYTIDKDGGINYEGYHFPKNNVFPTEDKKGRPVICIFNNAPRCAFIPYGA